MMNDFNLYPQAWACYVGLGILLLYLLDLKLRKTNFYLRAGVLSLLATGAFTPQVVNNADSYAPMVFTSLFNAEVEGASAVYQGLITLLIVWGIGLALILASKHLIALKLKK